MNDPGAPADPIRVLVVDDQELVRAGFGVMLDGADGITVVGEAAACQLGLRDRGQAVILAYEAGVVIADNRQDRRFSLRLVEPNTATTWETPRDRRVSAGHRRPVAPAHGSRQPVAP